MMSGFYLSEIFPRGPLVFGRFSEGEPQGKNSKPGTYFRLHLSAVGLKDTFDVEKAEAKAPGFTAMVGLKKFGVFGKELRRIRHFQAVKRPFYFPAEFELSGRRNFG